MEGKKEDLRTVRTKKLLRNALFKLIQEDSIENITVNGICDRAMVHRTTFYKHYEDKYQLLASLMLELQQSFVMPEDATRKYENRRELYLSVATRLFNDLAMEKEAYRRILEKNRRDVMFRICYDVTETAVGNAVTKYEKNPDPTVPLAVSAHFFAAGLASIALWYIQNNRSETVEDMTRYTMNLLCSVCDRTDDNGRPKGGIK